jgi:hypothetical protein
MRNPFRIGSSRGSRHGGDALLRVREIQAHRHEGAARKASP